MSTTLCHECEESRLYLRDKGGNNEEVNDCDYNKGCYVTDDFADVKETRW